MAEQQQQQQQPPQPQLLFDLFDSYWFSHQILNKPQTPPSKSFINKEPLTKTSQNVNFSSVPTINIRSHSDQLSINSKQHKFITVSPNSVLNLQTPTEVKQQVEDDVKEVIEQVKNKNLNIKHKSKSKSKSLSELEFEELKGFMDLGFMFSEKDKETSLVSIIPGLQRLGEDEKEDVHDCVNVSRPYLSEAWGDMEKVKEEGSRFIRVPVIGNGEDVKNQIRFWAHSVASVVR